MNQLGMIDSFFEGLSVSDEQAWAAFVIACTPRIQRQVRRCLGGRLKGKIDVEDIAQSVVRTFFKHAARGDYRFEEWSKVWALLAAIAVNKSKNRIRTFKTQSRDVSQEEYVEAESLAGKGEDPTAELAEFNLFLEEFCKDLSLEERHVLELWLEGYEIAETAKATGISNRSVNRVRKELSERLKKALGPDLRLKGL